MVRYAPNKPLKPVEIDKFLGLNESVGETETKLGEAVKLENFRITNNFKATKRKGYSKLIDFGNTVAVYGGWSGTLNSKNSLIVCNNGKAYEYDLGITTTTTAIADLITEGTVVELGTITSAPTNIFYFESKVYFQNGTDYKEYDGTTYQDVVPYVPIVATSTPPAGGGTLFEEINLLTGLKWQYFTGDGTATTYQLAETGIDATTVVCTINSVSVVEDTGFTVNRTNGTLDFSAGTAPHGAPANESDVYIKWDKVVSGNANLVKKHKYATIFGVGNNTTIFIWGNPDEKNVFRISGTLKANYFSATNYNKVSINEFAVTDIVPVYDRILIYKEDRTHYSYAETNPNYASNAGLNAYIYVVKDLNEAVGNVAQNGVQLLKNNPVSLYGHNIWQWTNTQIEDERNVKIVSNKIKLSLADLDLSSAITFDYQKNNEHWINIGSDVYIRNYENDTYYKYTNISANWFAEIDGEVYFGNAGKVEKMGGKSDNGVAISAVMELAFNDFGVPNLEKTTRRLWASIEPHSRTSVSISYATNKINTSNAKALKVIKYVIFDFADVDFSDFQFSTNRNIQTVRLKVRTKKYTSIKFIFKNEEIDEELTILNFLVKAESVGEV